MGVRKLPISEKASSWFCLVVCLGVVVDILTHFLGIDLHAHPFGKQ